MTLEHKPGRIDFDDLQSEHGYGSREAQAEAFWAQVDAPLDALAQRWRRRR